MTEAAGLSDAGEGSSVRPEVMVSPDVAVVSVVYDQPDDEVERLVAGLGSLDGGPYHVWLVVTKPGRALTSRHPFVTVVQLRENVGWTGGANEGGRRARAAGFRDVVFMNTDVELVASDLLTRLTEALRADPSPGLVSPGIVSSTGDGRVWYRGATLSTWAWVTRHPGITGRYRPSHRVVPTQVPNGCCMAVRGEVLDRLGGFDPELFAYFDEADLSLRAAAAGWASAFVDSPLLAHDHRGRELGAVSAYYFGRNPLLLAKKHLRAWRQPIVVLAQLGVAPVYLVRCQGRGARAAYLRGLAHGIAHLLGRPHVGRGHR